MTGAILALVSALAWGSGDFAGGRATQRSDQFSVLALSATCGIVLLLAIALAAREPVPPLSAAAWALTGGVSGAVGLACLYRSLATGDAATVAPIAAVITAAVPVLFDSLTTGVPGPTRLTGFAAALIGIWLVARPACTTEHSTPAARMRAPGAIGLAVSAGVAFGLFLILIAQVPASLVFGPLAIARVMTVMLAVAMLAARGQSWPRIAANPIAPVAGILDAAGNVFYMLARQHTRLDVAAVLSSFYPVATVVLARVISHERVSATQWTGAAVCLAAVALIVA